MVLSIKQRLLASHLFAVVVLAGAFGAFVYYMAAQKVAERLRLQLIEHAATIAGSLDPSMLDAAARDTATHRALVARLQGAAIGNAGIARVAVLHGDTEVASSDGDAAATEGEFEVR